MIRVGQFQGTRVDVGLAHGEEFGPLIREVIDIYRLVFGRPDDVLRELVRPFEHRTRASAPATASEIEAVASGAGLPTWWLYLLNSRSEIMGVVRDGCTAICDPRSRVLAQTWDWLGALESLIVVIDATDERGHRIVTMTEPGITAKIGMNCCGLGVSMTFLDAVTPADGVPVHVLLAELLHCTSVDEARQVTAAIESGRYAHVMVADRTGDAELFRFIGPTTRTERWIGPNPIGCTNHVVDVPATGGDMLDNSTRRLDTVSRLLSDQPPLDVGSAMTILADRSDGTAPIAAPYTGYRGVAVGTVATVAMDLARLRFDLRLGPDQVPAFAATLTCLHASDRSG